MWIVNSGVCVYFDLLVHKNHMSTCEFHRTWTIVVIWKKGITKPHMCIDFCHPYTVSGGTLVESLLFSHLLKPKYLGKLSFTFLECPCAFFVVWQQIALLGSQRHWGVLVPWGVLDLQEHLGEIYVQEPLQQCPNLGISAKYGICRQINEFLKLVTLKVYNELMNFVHAFKWHEWIGGWHEVWPQSFKMQQWRLVLLLLL